MGDYRDRFEAALKDDFNSAVVLAIFNEKASHINAICDKLANQDLPPMHPKEGLASSYNLFREIASVLGLLNRKPAKYLEEKKAKRIDVAGITAAEVEELIVNRKTARDNKDFQEADRIRDELAAKGVELKDSAAGTTWSVRAGQARGAG